MILQTNRLKWKSIYLGDHAFLTMSYEGNVNTKIIPRAKGVRIYSTNDLGGGMLKISVIALYEKSSRAAVESFLNSQDSIYNVTESGTLSIEDINPKIDLTGCVLESWNCSGEDLKVVTITYNFVKSL